MFRQTDKHASNCIRSLSHTLSGGVLVVLDEPSQAEVSDLTHQVISDQNVGSSQVPVDVVHPLNEGHAVCNLGLSWIGQDVMVLF